MQKYMFYKFQKMVYAKILLFNDFFLHKKESCEIEYSK